MSPVVALAGLTAVAIAVSAATARLRTLRRPTTPTAALLPLCAALEPNAWRSVVITQQPGRIQVNGDGDDVVPLLEVPLLEVPLLEVPLLEVPLEQQTRTADVVRDRMARAGQGEWVLGEEVVL